MRVGPQLENASAAISTESDKFSASGTGHQSSLPSALRYASAIAACSEDSRPRSNAAGSGAVVGNAATVWIAIARAGSGRRSKGAPGGTDFAYRPISRRWDDWCLKSCQLWRGIGHLAADFLFRRHVALIRIDVRALEGTSFVAPAFNGLGGSSDETRCTGCTNCRDAFGDGRCRFGSVLGRRLLSG